jgi:hypothetical protein
MSEVKIGSKHFEKTIQLVSEAKKEENNLIMVKKPKDLEVPLKQ